MQTDGLTSAEPRTGVWSRESGLARSDGADIYFETYGSGPAILFIPGAMDNILSWSFNIPHFVRSGYRVIAMNLRGHFMSPCLDVDAHFRHHADDIAAVLDACGETHAAIAASSFGGFGAIRFALHHPARVAALILSGSTAGVYSESAFAANSAAVNGLSASLMRGETDSGEKHIHRTDRPHAFLWRQINQLGTRPGEFACAFAAIESMNDRSAWLYPEDMAGYRVPTLIIGGDSDHLLGSGLQRETASLIPGAELSDYMDSGHIPFWENPDRYNRTVHHFLSCLQL